MKTKLEIKKQKSAQIIMAILISSALFVGGTFLWGYMKLAYFRASQIHSSMDASILLESIAGRIRYVLSRPYDALANCPDIRKFRDFTAPAPNPPEVSTTFNYTTAGINCIYNSTEISAFSSLTIKLTRVGVPNTDNLTVRLNLDMQGQTKIVPGQTVITNVKLNKSMVLRIATMNYFNLIFLPSGPSAQTVSAPPYIDVVNSDSGGALEVDGTTFFAHINPVALSDFVGTLPDAGGIVPVTFHKTVYFRSNTVLAETATPLDTSQLKKTFQGGVENGLMNHVVRLPHPTEDGTAEMIASWEQPTKYTHYWESNPAGPLPNLSYLNADIGPGVPGPNYRSFIDNAAAPGKLFDPAIAADVTASNITTFPIPGIMRLQDTCSTNFSPPSPLVYQRYQKNVTIDFANTGAPFADLPVFCGMIAANELIIQTPGAGNFALFGSFIVSKIRVLGQGRVYFYNPAENPVPAVGLPAGQNSFNLFQQLQASANSWGKNFWAPIFVNPATAGTPATIAPFRPMKADTGATNLGYMGPCTGAPANNSDRCLRLSPPALNYSTLAGHDNIFAYIIEDAT